MNDLLQAILDGLLVGGTYALLAAGLGLIFGVMRVINFAQADFMMLAMYLGFGLWSALSLDPLLSVPLAFVVFLGFGMVVHRGLVSRVTGSRENHEAQVILTLGLGIVFQNVALLVFTASPRLVTPPYANSGWRVGPFFIDQARTYAFLVAVAASVALYWFLNRSRTGRAIRAASQDWEAATYMGINIPRTHGLAFGLGTGLTAIGGVMLATFQPISPFVGIEYVVVMFVAVVLGGLGSVSGALLGGLAIGLIQSVSQVWSTAQLSHVWVFGLFLLVLYFRPQGLLGRAGRGV